MRAMFNKMTIVLAVQLSALVAEAQTIEIGEVQSAGSGCPANTVSVHENPNGPERLLLLSEMKAQSGRSTGKRFDRKSCMIAIPIRVPAGYSVALEGIVVGSQRTSRSGQSTLNQEFFYAGATGLRVSHQFRPGSASSFRQTSPALEWTPCGSDSILRANLSLFTQNSAKAQIEAVLLNVQWRQCQ